jgi:hypothetical protein
VEQALMVLLVLLVLKDNLVYKAQLAPLAVVELQEMWALLVLQVLPEKLELLVYKVSLELQPLKVLQAQLVPMEQPAHKVLQALVLQVLQDHKVQQETKASKAQLDRKVNQVLQV